MHPARRLAGSGTGLLTGRGGSMYRQRSRARLRSGQGTILSNTRRCESQPGAGEARSRNHGRGQQTWSRRDGLRRQVLSDRLQNHRSEPAARKLFRFGCVRMLGVPPPGRAPRCRHRRNYRVALPRSVPARRAHGARFRFHAHRARSDIDCSADGSPGALAESRRPGADQRRDVHRPRQCTRLPDEKSSSGRHARIGALPLWSCDDETRRRMGSQGRRSHDEHSRRALSGRGHKKIWRPRGDWQGRDGCENSSRA